MASTASPPSAAVPPPVAPGGEPARHPMRGRRALRRPAGLPSGRAVAGGLLVTLAALATFAAATSSAAGPTGTVVVAARPVGAGERLTVADLRVVATDLPDDVTATGFRQADELTGAVALAPLAESQVVSRQAVRAAGDGPVDRDLSFGLDRERALDGRLVPGDRIDVVATTRSGSDATTEVVGRDLRVVDATTTATGAGRVTVTVALADERDVVTVAHAVEVAEITLVRSTGTRPVGSGAPGEPTATAGPGGTVPEGPGADR